MRSTQSPGTRVLAQASVAPRLALLVSALACWVVVGACDDGGGKSGGAGTADVADTGGDAAMSDAFDVGDAPDAGGDVDALDRTDTADAADAADTTDAPRSDSGRPDGARPDAVPDAEVGADVAADGDSGADPIDLDVRDGCNPLATTDECLFPFPSRFFQAADPTTPTGVRSVYHNEILELPPGAPTFDFSAFNFTDGHSPAAPLLVHLGVDVDDAFLVGLVDADRYLEEDAPIAVFDLETGDRVPLLTEMDQNLRFDSRAGRHPLILRPMSPMTMGHRHVAVLTDAMRDVDGEELQPAPGFVALRDGVPTSNAPLEEMRDAFEDVFAFLGDEGYPRDEIYLAWDFAVASEDFVLGGILSMRERAMELSDGVGLGYTVDTITDAPSDDVARIVEGTFEVPNFLDEREALVRTPEGGVVDQGDTRWYPYTLVIPARAVDGDLLKLGVFGHGVFGTGRGYLTGGIGRDIIHPLAQRAGALVVATDWIGLSGGDRERLIEEVVSDLNNVHIITDRLQQGLINNLVLIELTRGTLQYDERIRLSESPLIDGDETWYYGVSLGGIQGSSLVSLSDSITRAVLAVPGGAWASLLTRSIVYAPIKTLVDLVYPDPLLQQAFISLLQAKFDGSDGVNVSTLMFRNPLPDAPPERLVVLQEAIGDCQVPNVATRILARAMGIAQLGPVHEPIFGLEIVEGPTTRPVVSQFAMPENLERYTPLNTNVVPTEDNGTHSDGVRLDSAIDQVMELIDTGTIEQFCDGPCDPD